MHYMLVNLLHSHYIQHVMYVITYPLHAFEDANDKRENIKETDVIEGGRSARAGRGVNTYDKHLEK